MNSATRMSDPSDIINVKLSRFQNIVETNGALKTADRVEELVASSEVRGRKATHFPKLMRKIN